MGATPGYHPLPDDMTQELGRRVWLHANLDCDTTLPTLRVVHRAVVEVGDTNTEGYQILAQVDAHQLGVTVELTLDDNWEPPDPGGGAPPTHPTRPTPPPAPTPPDTEPRDNDR